MIIGITGRIASGKTKFSKCLAEVLDYSYIECDKIIKDLKIYENWYDLSFSEYYSLFLKDKDFRKVIARDCTEYIENNYIFCDNYVIESAILFYSGLYLNCDKTIRIVTDKEERIKRMLKRGYSSWFIEEIEMIQDESMEDSFKTDITF